MVLGTPMMFNPLSNNFLEILCEPSPPMLMTQSMPIYWSFLIISSERSTVVHVPSLFLTGHENGPPLFVVSKMVPPLKCIPLTLSGVSLTISLGSHNTPLNACMLPSTSQSFSCEALFTMALITALRPGQSPPPVNTNTRFMFRCYKIETHGSASLRGCYFISNLI